MPRLAARPLLSILLAASLPSGAGAQGPDPDLPARFAQPFPLHPAALGDFGRPASTDDAEAQAYFDQGFQMMYAFATEDAARSFREAWKRDPDCAICYWGEAWAWGSYLNEPMSEEDAPRAWAAIRRALALADEHATPLERDLIHAMAARYVEDFDPERRAVQDSAYADAMRAVHERWPGDLDVATLYAEALFLLEPRRGTRDLEDPDVRRLHGVLESILAEDVTHPGACHLYIHATESTARPEKAEPCAEHIGTSIPGASHINHMPSHTWNEIGRWGDAVRANIRAWHSDQKAAIGEGFAIYPSHNLHMLLFAASMDGQGALAIQAGRDYAKLTGSTIYHVLTLLRFGRFDEVLDVDDRNGDPIHGGMWDFARGYAHLRRGGADSARAYLGRVQAAADTANASFRGHDAAHLLGVVGGILDGEIRRNDGDLAGAVTALRRAVELEDELRYDEPEPLPFSARHWLGAALLEMERFPEAEAVFRAELEDHPRNGWSLWGLRAALEAQGLPTDAVEEDLAASWARSDTWLRGSRF